MIKKEDMLVCDVVTTVQILGSKWKLLMELFCAYCTYKKSFYIIV